jgi:hypothetical protein
MVTELNENLMGFKRKLMEIVNEDQADQILNLFPPGIIMPLFYIGDVIRLKDGSDVIITNVSYKNGEYIYITTIWMETWSIPMNPNLCLNKIFNIFFKIIWWCQKNMYLC